MQMSPLNQHNPVYSASPAGSTLPKAADRAWPMLIRRSLRLLRFVPSNIWRRVSRRATLPSDLKLIRCGCAPTSCNRYRHASQPTTSRPYRDGAVLEPFAQRALARE